MSKEFTPTASTTIKTSSTSSTKRFLAIAGILVVILCTVMTGVQFLASYSGGAQLVGTKLQQNDPHSYLAKMLIGAHDIRMLSSADRFWQLTMNYPRNILLVKLGVIASPANVYVWDTSHLAWNDARNRAFLLWWTSVLTLSPIAIAAALILRSVYRGGRSRGGWTLKGIDHAVSGTRQP